MKKDKVKSEPDKQSPLVDNKDKKKFCPKCGNKQRIDDSWLIYYRCNHCDNVWTK